MNKNLKNLKKYLFPTVHNIIVSIIIFLLLIILFLTDENASPLLLLFIIFVPPILCWDELTDLIRLYSFLKHANTTKQLESILLDFQQGVPLFNDSIRVGETYLIGKKAAVPFLFDEIQQIYEHRIPLIGIHPFYHDRYIYATTPNGPQMLCMYPYKLPASEISQLYHLIKAKNPSVQWGVMKKKSFESNKYFEPFE